MALIDLLNTLLAGILVRLIVRQPGLGEKIVRQAREDLDQFFVAGTQAMLERHPRPKLLTSLQPQLIRMLHDIDPALTHLQRCWSQEGEDLIVSRLVDRQISGKYVDVGAHDPYRFSNTYLLYQSGWRGINIDANPASVQRIREARPADVCIEAFIGTEGEQHQFIEYDEPALSTSSSELVACRETRGVPYKVVGSRLVVARSLAGVLSEHLKGNSFDLLNIDVEGGERGVVESNDWQRFRPRIIIIEIPAKDVAALLEHQLSAFLIQRRYELFAKLYNSAIFVSAGAKE
jgi:FkbM family methyltransferase